MKMEIEKAHFLSWELGEFWRKHDYRFSHEPKGPETDSWFRAIRFFVGLRELEGSDMAQVRVSPAVDSLSDRMKRKTRHLIRGFSKKRPS